MQAVFLNWKLQSMLIFCSVVYWGELLRLQILLKPYLQTFGK